MTTYPALASVCAAHQYICSEAWIEPFVMTIAGRLGGPASVAHT
jgi:hypothetical protein